MKFRLTGIFLGVAIVALSSIAPLAAEDSQGAGESVTPVTLDKFPIAETHHMMKISIDTFGQFGEWVHLRGFTPIDQQNVVRMNRDTLYSSLVLDLTKPATITKPDTDGRYQSLLVINESHFSKLTVYQPGEYTLTQEEMGSRYVAVIARTLVDAEDEADIKQAHIAQNGLRVSQEDKGSFEVPNWDQIALEEIRDALKSLGNYLPVRDSAYGSDISKVDPVAYLIASADAWGGWEPENAAYQNFVPENNDGKSPYVLTLKDVPAGENAFWSISVYNENGYFVQNSYDKYVINSRSADINKDGSVTIHFGGVPEQPNFLPIMPGWNYLIRIYLPKPSYFDGSWVPAAALLVE